MFVIVGIYVHISNYTHVYSRTYVHTETGTFKKICYIYGFKCFTSGIERMSIEKWTLTST